MIRKSIMIPVVAVAASGIILLGASRMVHAQTPNETPFSGVAQAIAQKFNLNATDVENVISQQMKTNMQERAKTRLDQLVKNNKITSTQEQAILDEMTRIKNEYDPAAMKNMTADQRKQTMQKMHDEITSWAKSQGIDPKYFVPDFGMRHRGWFNKPTPTS
ncbi:MAG TPA: hypothetical protein VLG12_08065 [Candidatus Saccharimonadales bacterium]|nr:hypothetical protein [Candidatus Saccharimonadales bacterium]